MLNKIWWELRSIPRILWLKIRCVNRIKVSMIQDIFTSARFCINKPGRLEMDKGCHLKDGVEINISDGGKLYLGAHVCVNSNSHIATRALIKIGERTEIGPNVMIIDHDHDFRAKEGLKAEKYKTGSITIGKNVWLGANSVILKDVVLGDNCVVAAGTVVYKGIYEPNTLLYQERKIKTRQIMIEEN